MKKQVLKKCKDWDVEYLLELTCPYCQNWMSFNNGSDKPEVGDDIECDECGKIFLLG